MSRVQGSPEILAQIAEQIKKVIHGLEHTINSLSTAYRIAGNGWNDSKYIQLGEAVNQAIRAMKSPVPDLQVAIQKIKKMEADLLAYLAS